jgi:hypothetical protein
VDTKVSEKYTAIIFSVVSPKRWHLPTSLRSIKEQNNITIKINQMVFRGEYFTQLQ